MAPSGPPNPFGGNQPFSNSFPRANEGSPMVSQMGFANAVSPSPQMQYNGMDMLGNVHSVAPLLNQSFGNGGLGMNHWSSMRQGADSDSLANRMALASSFISPDAGYNGSSNPIQSRLFENSLGNQMLPQSQDYQSFQQNQQSSLQHLSAAQNGYCRDMQQSNQVNVEPHQSDQSLFMQQQQQLHHLSRQPPRNLTIAQMNFMNQQRLLQLQEQQLFGMMPQQQMSQFQQQFQTQNLSLRPGRSHYDYEPGTCARRLTEYMNHQRHRPPDNNIDFWRNFVSEYFAPHAKKRWCVSMYESDRPISGVFSQAAWHCSICNRKPTRGFEVTAVVLPRVFQVKYESGTFEELLYIDMPQEYHHTASGQTVLHYAKVTRKSVFDQLRVVHDGQLRIVFSKDLKICSWEFCARRHEELIPREVLLPRVSQLGAVAQQYVDASQKSNPKSSAPELRKNCNEFVTSARDLANALEVPLVKDLGYPKRYVRSLQISEVVSSMQDLIDYSRETGSGPMESLVKFPRRHNPSSQRNDPSPHQGDDGQPITATPMNIDSDQGLHQAATNGPLSASPPTPSNTGHRLVHQDSVNSRQQNHLSNGHTHSSYTASSHEALSPSNTVSGAALQHSGASPFNSPTASSSNNPVPMSDRKAVPEADENGSPSSVKTIIHDTKPTK